MEKVGMQFRSFEVLSVAYNRTGTHRTFSDFEVEVSQNLTKDEINSTLTVKLIVSIKSTKDDSTIEIAVDAEGHFDLIGEISEEILNNYLKINAPSIVYPYVRAFITNFTAQAGISAIILPTVNFSAVSRAEVK